MVNSISNPSGSKAAISTAKARASRGAAHANSAKLEFTALRSGQPLRIRRKRASRGVELWGMLMCKQASATVQSPRQRRLPGTVWPTTASELMS